MLEGRLRAAEKFILLLIAKDGGYIVKQMSHHQARKRGAVPHLIVQIKEKWIAKIGFKQTNREKVIVRQEFRVNAVSLLRATDSVFRVG